MKTIYKEIVDKIEKSIEQVPAQIKEVEATIEQLKRDLETMDTGDGRENAGLTDNRERQAKANMELLKLDRKLRAWKDFKFDMSPVYVQEGTFICLHDVEARKDLHFLIVPQILGNSLIGALSVTTPVAKAILGRKQGEQVTVPTTEGKLQYIIKEVVST